MGAIRYWYEKGQIIEIADSANLLSQFILEYGRGFHTSWRTSGTRIPFYGEQFEVLQEMLQIQKIVQGPGLDYANLKKEIRRLVTRNRVFKGALVHLFFIPDKKIGSAPSTDFSMLIENHSEDKFVLNTRGLKIGQLSDPPFFEEWFMPRIGNFNPVHLSFEDEQQRMNWDAAFFTNRSGKIVEFTDGNIFVIKDNKLFSPASSMGISPRAIRKVIFRIAASLGLQLSEIENLEAKHLDTADEIFYASDQRGIRWVVGYGNRRYFRKYSELINTIINREWIEST